MRSLRIVGPALVVIAIFTGANGCAPNRATRVTPLETAPPRETTPVPTEVQPFVVERTPDSIVERPRGGARIVLGSSVEERPIEAYEFGTPYGGILILGGIHGNERASVFVAERLLAELHSAPKITGVTVVPCANPDGFEHNTRCNARGVDLNRNFPAKNWQAAAARHGEQPGSEPETAALLALLERKRPRLIVSIHCIHGTRECNNYDGPARAIAEKMSGLNGYPALGSIGYPTPGSLGSYSGVERGIPVITLELPQRASGEEAWARNRSALLILLSESVAQMQAGPVRTY